MKISWTRAFVNREIRNYILTNLAYTIMTNHENTTCIKDSTQLKKYSFIKLRFG
jgi:hypothetical protein